jgi:hypothetical protein
MSFGMLARNSIDFIALLQQIMELKMGFVLVCIASTI